MRATRRWFLAAKYTRCGDVRPIDRPPSWYAIASGTHKTSKPALRALAQNSTSSNEKKNASSNNPAFSNKSRRTSIAQPLTAST
jgi:hypothetical protein